MNVWTAAGAENSRSSCPACKGAGGERDFLSMPQLWNKLEVEDPKGGRTAVWMASDRKSKDPEVGNLCTACSFCETPYPSPLLISAPGCCGSQGRDMWDVKASPYLSQKLLKINF